MEEDRTRPEPRVKRHVYGVRIVVYPLLVVATCLVAALRLGWLNVGPSASASPLPELRGGTDERQAISVGLSDSGSARALQTTLIGVCENGGTYRIGWAPDSPRIPFRTSNGVTTVRETARQEDGGSLMSVTTA